MAQDKDVNADFVDVFISMIAKHRFNERPDLESISA